MKSYIHTKFKDYHKYLNLNGKFISSLKKELSKFNTSEELLRSGGLCLTQLKVYRYLYVNSNCSLNIFSNLLGPITIKTKKHFY